MLLSIKRLIKSVIFRVGEFVHVEGECPCRRISKNFFQLKQQILLQEITSPKTINYSLTILQLRFVAQILVI